MTSVGKLIFRCGLLALLVIPSAWPSPVLLVTSNVSGVPCTVSSWSFCSVFPEQWSATGPIQGSNTSSSGEGSVLAAARADFGSLGAQVSATAFPGGAVNGAAMAFMRDTWTITGGTPGAVGSFAVPISLDGAYDFNWSRNLSFYVGIDFPGGTPDHVVGLTCRIGNGCQPNTASPYSGVGVYQGAFHFGVPFDIVLSLIADTGALNGATQSINAWNSAKITGVSVFDQGGQPVTGFSLTAASGHDYLASGASVPEPASWTLLILGAAAFVIGRKAIRR